MTFAKTFGQRHVLRFLDSHVNLFGCRVTAASPVGLRVTDGVHQLCLKSTDGCIQREDDLNSVAPEVIEVYGSTARRTAVTKRGELSRMPRDTSYGSQPLRAIAFTMTGKKNDGHRYYLALETYATIKTPQT